MIREIWGSLIPREDNFSITGGNSDAVGVGRELSSTMIVIRDSAVSRDSKEEESTG
jgi:hypothetical protein